MKNRLFNLFKDFFKDQIIAYLLNDFPKQLTTETRFENYRLIAVKRGKIRETRLFNSNHERIHRFQILSNGNVKINP